MRLDERSPSHANATNKENIPGYYRKKDRGMSDEEIIAAYQANGGGVNVSGTSIFDPVLCELVYRWFVPPGGRILDPFAGGSVRGIVASALGFRYTGIDLSARQLAANEKQAQTICRKNKPRWITGDSRNLKALFTDPVDFVFSCPPYFDLEVYSEDPSDLSTFEWPDFLTAYRQIIAACVERLKPNRFTCFVVGDVRDKKGFYRNLPGETVAAFEAAGAVLYNEAILVTAVGSLPIRITRQFEAGRKLGKTHQNVLAFFKGDPQEIREWALPEFGAGWETEPGLPSLFASPGNPAPE